METIVVVTIDIFVVWSMITAGIFAFNYLQETSLDITPNDDPIHNQFLLSLAIEADELRNKEQSATDPQEKALYCDGKNDVSLEVVDTVLAMNGFDPHPDAFLDDEEDEVTSKVIDFAFYNKPKKF